MKTHNGGPANIAILLGSVVIYGLLCVPANAQAVKPPSRIANIYDGFDHQPTRSDGGADIISGTVRVDHISIDDNTFVTISSGHIGAGNPIPANNAGFPDDLVVD